MQKKDLKPGDFVELLSGGPTMTVIEDATTRDWRCGWFSQGQYLQADFRVETLKKIAAPKQYKGLL